MGDTATAVLAVLTGSAGVAAAAGGVLLTVRRVRTREQQAAEAALKATEAYLIDEREHRIEAERRAHDLGVILAQHGIDDATY